MQSRPLGQSGLRIAPLVLGANVMGWTIDRAASFAVLDAFLDHGFDAIDTADIYSRWHPGNQGGESESIIGEWFAANPGKRDKVVLFTKVGMDMGGPGRSGLSARWIAEEVEASLRRLRTDRIDLYFSHCFDPSVPAEETLGAYQALIAAGKVRAIGASNFDAAQLGAALWASEERGLPRYTVLQPLYNLYDRESFEGPLRELCIRERIGVVPYYALASGFLTGKYRTEADLAQSARGATVGETYLNPRGLALLDRIAAVAEAHGAEMGEVALAWLMAREGVTAPIASATSVRQVEGFARAARLTLTPGDLARLEPV